jgi:DNA-binding MarR family transcriptional regulator
MKHDCCSTTESLRAFRRSLRALEREIGLSMDRETTCCGVTAAQCHFLLEAEARPDAGLVEFSQALSLDPSTLSRTADGLTGEGFTLREPDPANRRKVSIRLTEAGKAKVDSINELCDASYRRVLEHIPPEKRDSVVEAVGLLAAALARLRSDSGAAGGCQ